MSIWNIDSAHSVIAFKIRHLGISKFRGNFKNFEGSITSGDDSFENSQAEFSINADSIDTNNAMREGHLKSGEFFDVQNFPNITFKSTSFTKKGEEFEMIGDLTIKDITKSITLEVELNGIGTNTEGVRVASFEIEGSINREDFGLTWNQVLEAGGFVLGKDVKIDIQIEAKEV